MTVLGIAGPTLAKSKSRLGARVSHVTWIVADVTRWHPLRPYVVRHDRAMFHFLTNVEEQDASVTTLRAEGATVIMATLAPEGPEQCSGLPVQRYSPGSPARCSREICRKTAASVPDVCPLRCVPATLHVGFDSR